ncbi:MAG: peptidylprolyl isomerase [Phycisphaerales bacterium]|nr:peptidylprolyl isomerase [Phycisphaerales bacterium]
MTTRSLFMLTLFTLATFTLHGIAQELTPNMQADPGTAPATEEVILLTIDTTRGPIHMKLYPEKAPLTVANFVNLSHRKFYDNVSFHRVIPNFMIQGGDPTGTGRGGPGYRFRDETDTDLRHSKPGILSMANAGPGTNGSQFFITHTPTPHLNGKHTVFGEVVNEKDQAIVNKIQKGDTIKTIIIESDTTNLMDRQKKQIDAWNAVLDKKHPDLPKYPPAAPAEESSTSTSPGQSLPTSTTDS